MPWEVASDIARRLKRLRTVLGLTQAEFGQLFGRSWKTVSGWERGKVRPEMGVLERAARKNGWPISIFTEGELYPSADILRPTEDARRASEAALAYNELERQVLLGEKAFQAVWGLQVLGKLRAEADRMQREIDRLAALLAERGEDEAEGPNSPAVNGGDPKAAERRHSERRRVSGGH